MAKIMCEKCGTEYKFEVAKDFDCCPVCKAPLVGDDGVSSYYNNETGSAEDEHPDWITWYYYKDPEYGDYSLWDKLPNDPEALTLIQEFKAPPEEKCGLEEVKRILRTYIPDAFVYKKKYYYYNDGGHATLTETLYSHKKPVYTFEALDAEDAERQLKEIYPNSPLFGGSSKPKIMCPRCFSTSFQLLPRKWSLLTGFATNRFDRVCDHCGKRF